MHNRSPLGHRLVAFGLAFCLTLTACSTTAAPTPSNGKLRVIGTVSPIVNLIYNIGGDKLELSGIVPEGVNSHTFEPKPSDAKRIAAADLIFINGLHLEEPTRKLVEANRKAGSELIELGPQTITPEEYAYDFSFPKEAGDPNPHLWLNPLYAQRYAELVRATLVRRDPANAAYYQDNYTRFAARITALDSAIQTAIGTVPPTNRKLLTYHDSWAYFAPRYGLTVIGAIQPSDFAEPSAQDVADLIAQVRASGVPAIFGSEVFPSTVLETIGRETGANYVDTLRDDDLPGAPGDPLTYLGMLITDVQTMVSVLGGDPVALATLDPANIPGPDTAVNQEQ